MSNIPEPIAKKINRANYLRERDKEQGLINNKRDIPYTMIDNYIIRHKGLSWAEKGLLSYLLHLENGKTIQKTKLFENSENGRDGTIAIFDSLEKKGYILSVRHITNDGKYLWEYFVYNKPQNTSIEQTEPLLESRNGNAGTVNQETYISNTSSIEDISNNNNPDTPGIVIPEFDEFWDAYLKKGSKADAKLNWDKLKPDEKLSAIKAINHYLVEQKERVFLKDAERYLKKKIFNDVLERQATQKGEKNSPLPPSAPKMFSEEWKKGFGWM